MRLVYSAIVAIWIMIPALVTIVGTLSTDIIKGTCVSWGAFASYVAEKTLTSTLIFFAYLFPTTTIVCLYARIAHTLRTKVTFTLSVSQTRSSATAEKQRVSYT